MIKRLLAATALCTTVGFLVPGAARADSDWSGFYFGLGVNTTDSASREYFAFDYPFSSIPDTVPLPALGAGATVTGGYNFQQGGFVYGIEADGTLMSLGGTHSNSDYTITDRLDGLLSLRGRLGLATGPLMLYATAGVAAGHASVTTFLVDDSGTGPFSLPDTASGIVTGPIAGVGAEFAVNDNISLKTEGLVYALSGLHTSGDTGKGGYDGTYLPRGVSVQTGINFHIK